MINISDVADDNNSKGLCMSSSSYIEVTVRWDVSHLNPVQQGLVKAVLDNQRNNRIESGGPPSIVFEDLETEVTVLGTYVGPARWVDGD